MCVCVSVCGGCGCVLVLQSSIKSRVRPCEHWSSDQSTREAWQSGKLRPTTNTRTGHPAPLILPPSGPASRRSNHPQLLSILGCLGNRAAWHGGGIPALQRSFPTLFHLHTLDRWSICFVSLISKLNTIIFKIFPDPCSTHSSCDTHCRQLRCPDHSMAAKHIRHRWCPS